HQSITPYQSGGNHQSEDGLMQFFQNMPSCSRTTRPVGIGSKIDRRYYRPRKPIHIYGRLSRTHASSDRWTSGSQMIITTPIYFEIDEARISHNRSLGLIPMLE